MAKINSKQAVNFVTQYSIYVITLVFMIICAFINDRFLTVDNIINILRQVSVYALLAFAESVCIISGNLDLAAASTLVFAGCLSIFDICGNRIFDSGGDCGNPDRRGD